MLEIMNNKISHLDILDNINYDNNDIVFLSGSLIEGHGNDKSDLDIFILVKEGFEVKTSGSAYNFGSMAVDFVKINNISCDIEYWKLENVITLFNQINELKLEDGSKRVLNQIKVENIDFYTLTSFIHRFLTSRNIAGEDIQKQLINTLDVNKYFELMMLNEINNIDNTYEDIVGNYENKEFETSLLLTRTAMIKSIKVILFSLSESLDRDKWAYLKLKRLKSKYQVLTNVKNKFDNITFRNISDDNIQDTIEESIFFINEVIEEAQRRRIKNGK